MELSVDLMNQSTSEQQEIIKIVYFEGRHIFMS